MATAKKESAATAIDAAVKAALNLLDAELTDSQRASAEQIYELVSRMEGDLESPEHYANRK